MGKKIIYIVLGALIVFGLLFLLWSWFFSGATPPADKGSLGSAGDTSQTTGGAGDAGNGQTRLSSDNTIGAGSYNAQGVYVGDGNGTYDAQGNYVGTRGISGGTGTTGGAVSGGLGGTGRIGGTGGLGGRTIGGGAGTTTTPGVTWLGTPFNPLDINSLEQSASGTVPTIIKTTTTKGGTDLLTALAGTAIAGTLSCAIQAGIGTQSTAAATAATAGAAAVKATLLPAPFPGNPLGPGPLVGGTGIQVVADYGQRVTQATSYGVQTSGYIIQAQKENVTFLGCLTNVVAKTALQKMTISIVNWINSGFKGQPSFITNYEKFFTNVADAAAGEFIKGAGLSFLCSPFQMQIKIAIAQSYANRSAASAGSCTLTKVIKNVNSFMNGKFSQGGWGGFVSFITTPTNNPYGAYSYAQNGLNNSVQKAQLNASKNISPTGFISLQEIYGCDNASYNGIGGGMSFGVNAQAAIAAGSAGLPKGCKAKIVTPGDVIAQSLGAVSKSGVDQLGLANDINQIITALTNQLLTRMLQGGLPSLSQTANNNSMVDTAAQEKAMALLNDMKDKTTLAGQLGTIAQGSIADIQNAQAGLNGLFNCWDFVATTTGNVTAAENATKANAAFQSLESRVSVFNDMITAANSKIAVLNEFQSDISIAASAADVDKVAARYNAMVAAGTFTSQADVTTAQQDRTALQAEMAAQNIDTQISLTECKKAGGK